MHKRVKVNVFLKKKKQSNKTSKETRPLSFNTKQHNNKLN